MAAMILFEILLALIVILHLADTSHPKLSQISFQKLLDTCTKPENSNSEDCKYFVSTYRWQYDDIPLVFDKVLGNITSGGSPAMNILEKRLLHLIENPKFALGSLGNESFKRAIVNNKEPLAFAIWPHLKKYQTELSDLQLKECSNSLADIIKMKMLPMLKKIVTDHPDCLHQVNNSLIEKAIVSGNGLALIEFLTDHGVEFTPNDLVVAQIRGYSKIFEWAILKYRHSKRLIYNVSQRYVGYAFLAHDIWNCLKQNNYSDLLNQICNDKILEVVQNDQVGLFEMMMKDCPDCIHLHKDSIIDSAIRRDSTDILLYLVYRGVEITPEQIQILRSRYGVRSIDFFRKMVVQNNIEMCQKILSYNAFGIEEIRSILDNSDISYSKECVELLQEYLNHNKNVEGV